MNFFIKIIFGTLLMAIFFNSQALAQAGNDLKFNPDTDGEEKTLVFFNGKEVTYRAYENIYYVANVADSTYQYLNFYVPESAYKTAQKPPVFLKTNIGGYMSAKASQPTPTDATGRALFEGYIVVIPGSRGSNSIVNLPDGRKNYTGKAPAGLLDLKAAIRYLRYNSDVFPGDVERIITDGTSAGGAMSSLLGATGNNPDYEHYLREMGAANARDDIFAAVCYCPITDLEHADMAYEWLYHVTNAKSRNLNAAQINVSEELAALYPAYLNGLKLKKADGSFLIAENYLDYLKTFLIKSAQKAKDEGADIPDNAGILFNSGFRGSQGEFIVDIDLNKYLEYVIFKRQLKTPPAFDQMGVLTESPSPENNVFGNANGNAANFTDYSIIKSTNGQQTMVEPEIKKRVKLMNPMNFIGDGISSTAQHWYIRHGALDRDTGFQIPINLYTKLINNGYNVNFALAWNRGHMGDYNLDDLFEWLAKITNK